MPFPCPSLFVSLFVCLFVIYLFEQVEVLTAIKLMWTCHTHPYTQRTATTPRTSCLFVSENSRIFQGDAEPQLTLADHVFKMKFALHSEWALSRF